MTAAEIASVLGGALRAGAQWLARCPVHPDRNPSLALRDGDDGQLLVHCFAGCDGRAVLAELRRRGLLDGERYRERLLRPSSTRAQRHSDEDQEQRVRLAHELWDQGKSMAGTLAEVYLVSRGLSLTETEALRFHPSCPRGKHERHPALIAKLTDIKGGDFRAIHRIFLQPDGRDRLRDEIGGKLSLGLTKGTVARLSADEEVTTGLGLAEGIEDGIAIMNSGWRPVWATVGRAGMASFPILDGIEALTLFCDNDAAGRNAARSCAERWHAANGETRIIDLPAAIKDHNDLVREALRG